MISDVRNYPGGAQLTADIAIIGGGAAAIAMVRQLAGTRLKVMVLESGGLTLEEDTQDLNAGSRSGLPYFELAESRYRMLGGSTFRWGARSAPFKQIDMASRPWLDVPTWPISRQCLQPFYDRHGERISTASPWARQAELI